MCCDRPQWSQDASVSAGVGFGNEKSGLSIGASLNSSYSFNHDTWNAGWGTSLGTSTNSGTFSGSVGYGGDFHGNNNWSWGANGQFVGDYSEFGISKKYEEIEGLTAHRIEPFGDNDKFGHYWFEADGKGYGYWPGNDGATPKEAIFNKEPGQTAMGDDPHYGDRNGHRYKQYKIYAPKGKGAAYYKEQLQSLPASHFGKQYGVPFGKNCHTYYRSYINRNDLLTVRF